MTLEPTDQREPEAGDFIGMRRRQPQLSKPAIHESQLEWARSVAHDNLARKDAFNHQLHYFYKGANARFSLELNMADLE